MKLLIISIVLIMLSSCDQDSPKQQVINKATVKSPSTPQVFAEKPESQKYSFDVVPERMTVQEKKERFRQLMVPAVKRVFNELTQQHEEVSSIIRSGSDTQLIERLKTEYKADSEDDLLIRLKPHPVSIVLAQAAVESGWATSRLFKEGKNIFGVWSFDKNEPRIAAAKKRGSKTIWLKKYNTIEDSIRDNYRVMARGWAYSKFRDIRLKTNDPFKIVKGLDKYSELGSKYVDKLASVIRYNKFNQFDL